MKAVDVTELYRWPDVVIIATQGPCSLASLLAGCGMLIYHANLFSATLLWY